MVYTNSHLPAVDSAAVRAAAVRVAAERAAAVRGGGAQTWVTCTAEGRAWARAHARTILVGARESAQVSQRSQAQSASQPRVLNRTRDARAARSPRSLTDWCVAQSVPDPSVLLCGQGLALPSLRASLTPAIR